mmetsp:Transcript_134708/g.375448  ORF Transcript_134708/g.375448 Transcript_134708/m.375448 type:complete len:243 (-) Transcript_134708:382-1110(-)
MRRVGDLIHGRAASLLDTTPVEIVTNVDKKFRILLGGARDEGLSHQQLRLVVNAGNKAATLSAGGLPVGVEALDKLLVRTELLGVPLVPPRPGEDAGAGPVAPVVRDDLRAPLDRVEGAIHAPPVANGEHVDLVGPGKGHRRPLRAHVVQRLGRRHARDGGAVLLAARALGLRCLAAKARVARRGAASAWRQAAGLAAWRRAEEETLEVLLCALVVVDARDLLHLGIPLPRMWIILTTPGRP